MQTKTLRAAAVASALVMFEGTAAAAAQADTLKKLTDTGVITTGVRDGSGAISFTTGAGK